MQSFRRNACKMSGKTIVDGNVVASADFMAMVIDR
jgi:3-hydroxymyristoyl/3-hydroxydecanoyl-(acyl carrier protein) dehydratase